MKNSIEVFLIFLRLGLTSFGGPVAHLGYFHDEFVVKRKWLNEQAYADLVALCQFLPGPASSQVGIAVGLSRAGLAGAFLAWLGFTLPSAVLLVAFALGLSTFQSWLSGAWLHGLKVVAVAVVAQALWSMGRKLCPDRKRTIIALMAAAGATLLPSAWGQIIVILCGAVFGILILNEDSTLPHAPLKVSLGPVAGLVSFALFAGLLAALPDLAASSGWQGLKMFDSFFRAGSLVFGGGHVVLPLLKAEVVSNGWVSSDVLMAGYGAAQAVPGPLFTFAAYIGAVSNIEPHGVNGASIGLLGVFSPSFLLVFAALPFWEKLRRVERMRKAMMGINAAVVGLLLAAFYDPVWTSAIFSLKDFSLALICFLALLIWKFPSWSVVLLGAFAAVLFQ